MWYVKKKEKYLEEEVTKESKTYENHMKITCLDQKYLTPLITLIERHDIGGLYALSPLWYKNKVSFKLFFITFEPKKYPVM